MQIDLVMDKRMGYKNLSINRQVQRFTLKMSDLYLISC